MSSSLIRGKYIIGRVIDNDRAEVIEDGAIFQRDGKIVEIGAYEELSGRHHPDEVLGDGSHIVVPGFVNGHHHVGVTPFQLGCPVAVYPIRIKEKLEMGVAFNYLLKRWDAITRFLHAPGAPLDNDAAYAASGIMDMFSGDIRGRHYAVPEGTLCYITP